jgi:hypothetical protein
MISPKAAYAIWHISGTKANGKLRNCAGAAKPIPATASPVAKVAVTLVFGDVARFVDGSVGRPGSRRVALKHRGLPVRRRPDRGVLGARRATSRSGRYRQAANYKHHPVSRAAAHCESSYAGPHVRSLELVLTTKDRQL